MCSRSHRPELVERVHRRYLDAGADALTTNTFNGTAVSLADYGLADRAFELNRLGAENARRAIAAHAASENGGGRPRFVLGSMARRTGRSASRRMSRTRPAGRSTWDELRAAYLEQARGLLAGGARHPAGRDLLRHPERQGGARRPPPKRCGNPPGTPGCWFPSRGGPGVDATSRARTPSPSGSPWSTRASPPAESTAPSAPR